MIAKLTNGAYITYLADGVGRTYQNLSTLGFGMQQSTQVANPLRALFPVAFPDRASRVYSFDLPVMFPANASLELALAQLHDFPAQCPRGGALAMVIGATQRSYSQAWINTIKGEQCGASNLFTFSISAVNPSTTTLSTLGLMDTRYTWNLAAVTGLTGGGINNLDGYTTTDVDATKQPAAVITATIGAVVQTKTFRLVAGMDATNTDPLAGTLIVRPADYNASTNAKVWKEVL